MKYLPADFFRNSRICKNQNLNVKISEIHTLNTRNKFSKSKYNQLNTVLLHLWHFTRILYKKICFSSQNSYLPFSPSIFNNTEWPQNGLFCYSTKRVTMKSVFRVFLENKFSANKTFDFQPFKCLWSVQIKNKKRKTQPTIFSLS